MAGFCSQNEASVTSPVKALGLKPFGMGHGSVLLRDPPGKVRHPAASGDEKEGVREDAASASGGKAVPCPKLAAAGRVGARWTALDGEVGFQHTRLLFQALQTLSHSKNI